MVCNKMLPINDKYYHHNGLCHLFMRIHSKMVAAQDNILHSHGEKRHSLPYQREVADDEVYHKFLKLQILRGTD